MEIVWDIETIPDQTGRALATFMVEAEILKAECTAPSNYKDPGKIAVYIEEAKAEIDAGIQDKLLKTSFDGLFGHIAVIGYAIDDRHPVAVYRQGTDPSLHEGEVLKQFFDELSAAYVPSRDRKPVFIGHNIVNFDLRFLFQRAVMLGIKPPLFIPFNAKPWDDVVYDTMAQWAGFGKTVKLDVLAKAMGLPGKGTIDGSQVWPLVAAGKIDEVADYCIMDDVQQTREIARRMRFMNIKPPAMTAEDPIPF